ncbi:MAG: short-chain dehydrogenase [Planctomycetota bacterium]|jgi:NAD(P)-dependent dehydrogenase (short-subunit alcohol dehydrogenase family)
MDLRNKTVLILGGAGLVGLAVARRALEGHPSRIVLGSLRREEAEEACATLKAEPLADGVAVDPAWGDLFLPKEMGDMHRRDILDDDDLRARMIDDMYGELTGEVFERSTLGTVLAAIQPDAIVDCINTAGVLAYQNVFGSAAKLRSQARSGEADISAVEQHLSTLYLPQLIRHTQILLEGMKRAGTEVYVKVGTAGTGGMGLNIPFTHSEERPSRMLLAKSSLAGAQTLLLYLMARTPGAPAVKEVKPTAAISWKSIARGPIKRGGKPIMRADATEPIALGDAFGGSAEGAYTLTDEVLEGVYLDAGENGVFTLGEFEALTALGLMEFVTPEEIAQNVVREIQAHPTGTDIVSALDAASMGPTYRAGVLRSAAIGRMEELEVEEGVPSVAFEMLGPPRLSKLLFEGAILAKLYDTMAVVRTLDPEETAAKSKVLIEEDSDLRQRIVSIGLPILMPDGAHLLRGPDVKVAPEEELPLEDQRLIHRGWVDLRAENWARWQDRIEALSSELERRPSVDFGSLGDHEYGAGDGFGKIRPGRLAAWIFRHEEGGERIKR